MPGDDRYGDGEKRRSAHDLLQSVAIMQALIGALRALDAIPPDGHRTLDQLGREVQLVAALCQRQIDEQPVMRVVDLAAVAVEVVDRARLTFGGEITLETIDVTIEGDPIEWQRCLYNLVENATRAATHEGKVEVRVARSDGSIRLSVGDSGPGFGQAVAGRASLGLGTVTRVVESHSGHVELREGPLGGAQLTVVIPAQD